MSKVILKVAEYNEWWGPLYNCPFCDKLILWSNFKFCPLCGKSLEGYGFIENYKEDR
jgi:rRNA maturation endonuclease Nob1